MEFNRLNFEVYVRNRGWIEMADHTLLVAYLNAHFWTLVDDHTYQHTPTGHRLIVPSAGSPNWVPLMHSVLAKIADAHKHGNQVAVLYAMVTEEYEQEAAIVENMNTLAAMGTDDDEPA